MKDVLSLENVNVFREKKHILCDISCSLEKGTIVGILGANGSGKTTLLRTLAGFLPYFGNITFCGEHYGRLSCAKRAEYSAFLAQDVLSTMQTVRERVLLSRYRYTSFLAGYSAEDRAICEENIYKVSLEHFIDTRLDMLSGGERQRVEIARVLSQETPLLIFDEATSALDSKYAIQVMQLLQDVALNGGLCLVSIHDINIASLFCNTILLLKEGKTIAYGTPEEVLTKENIAIIYDISVCIFPHPTCGVPQILLQP